MGFFVAPKFKGSLCWDFKAIITNKKPEMCVWGGHENRSQTNHQPFLHEKEMLTEMALL